MDDEMNEVDALSFRLIADAGQARSLAFEALSMAKKGDFAAADDLMKQAQGAFLAAHECQTGLLVKEANGEHTPVNVMLVHAQDHLMTSMLAQELIAEIIELRRENVSSEPSE